MSTTVWIVLALLLMSSWLLLVRRQRRQWRTPYIPARARIEGGGVKRGLTSPEAAILLGRPLSVALTLVIFDLLRKGFVRQVAHAPLAVDVVESLRTHGSGLNAEARSEKRLRAAQALRKALHKYEEAFLEILETNPGVPIEEIDYGIAIQPLVRYVAGRVGGYDLADTRRYYELIIERAPREARSDGVLTTERQKVFDRNFGWVLLGEDFQAVLDAADYSYVPVWLREEQGAGGLVGTSFAEWAQAVMAGMETAIQEESATLDLDRESDSTTLTLMNDIARATFHG